MTSNIQPFTHEQFGTIRTITDVSGEVWFVATDICAALDLSNTTVALQRLDADEKSKFNLGLPGGATWCVNEAGLYSLVLASRKPEAKSFKRWVTHEVLPSIRKHGGYLTDQKIEDILNNPDTIIQLATKLKSERAKRAALEKQAAIDTPKARFADAVSASHTSILIGDLAKLLRQNGYEIGQNRLFEMLRRNGYLCSAKGGLWNMPTQKAMDLNLFEVKETTIVHSDGHVSISKTTKVTGKGQVYFVTRFLDGRLPKGINDEEAA
ncbi:phage antirepressor [uncultured Cutibacterium sp.]|uniref:phage antirepressor n=1 Tax=uncultured Cutibacterium sp. TaxID=1912223 RepID=UPI0028047BFF|nr:phage antirepressor [uncultured Cutibacterium sp.]MDU1580854.1 phage antirepressor [Cutibacterium granulosum]